MNIFRYYMLRVFEVSILVFIPSLILCFTKLFCFLLGESGLGKSTLINSLFLTELYSPEYPGPSHRIKKTVQVCLGGRLQLE